MNRKLQGLFVVGALVAVIAGALALVQAGFSDLQKQRCVIDMLWLGCAMAAHENLAGGLIGAAGALFAGWLAWSAVREQIELDRTALRDAARAASEETKRRAQEDLEALEIVQDFVSRLATPFRFPNGPIGKAPYIQALRRMYQDSRVSGNLTGVKAPHGLAAKAEQRKDELLGFLNQDIYTRDLPVESEPVQRMEQGVRRTANAIFLLVPEIEAAIAETRLRLIQRT